MHVWQVKQSELEVHPGLGLGDGLGDGLGGGRLGDGHGGHGGGPQVKQPPNPSGPHKHPGDGEGLEQLAGQAEQSVQPAQFKSQVHVP